MQVNIDVNKKKKFDVAAKANNILQNLKTKTPADLNNYINNNVTDLASARELLKIYGLILMWLVHKENL